MFAGRRLKPVPLPGLVRLLIVGTLLGPALASAALPSKTATVLGPFVEYELHNPSYSGNPFDLRATATFAHDASGERITTGMFYAGGDRWKFRFTATRPGSWQVTTSSSDADLAGQSGTVNVGAGASGPGFVTAHNGLWIRSGNGRAFAPQLVMYAGPHYFSGNDGRVRADIDTFLVQYGFSGFHVPVFCRWFDINQSDCSQVAHSDPDLDSFAALDLLIQRVYEAGGIVHLWAWGDDSRRQNPKSLPQEGGINGTADQRLQRYIAARLGPLPGWTLGYGFDLFEWVGRSDVEQWHSRMQAESGYPHLLGARGATDSLDQISRRLDYASYEQHRPDYSTYVRTIDQRSDKPAFSEDRFRFRGDSQRSKDYQLPEMRRGIWRSHLAGGIANIWGNLTRDGRTYEPDINSGVLPSAPFGNAQWFKTAARFWAERLSADRQRCPSVSTQCLHSPSLGTYVLYAEDASTITINLPEAGTYQLSAVDTTKAYRELWLSTSPGGSQTLALPATSDWAVAIITTDADSSDPGPEPDPEPNPNPEPDPEPGPSPVPDRLAPAAPTALQLYPS